MTKILTCEEVIQQLYTYLDRELGVAEEIDVQSHIHHCKECFGRAEFERCLKKRVKKTRDVDIPDELNDRVDAIIKSL